MAGFFDLVAWLLDAVTPGETEEGPTEAEVADRAQTARGDTVTAAVLANSHERGQVALVEYLDDGEQPHHVFRGMKVMISDESGSVSRHHPTRETQVVFTDRRVLIVLGGNISDEVWELPFDSVEEIYLDDAEVTTTYLVIDGVRDDAPMTFFVDVSMEPNRDELARALEAVGAVDP